MKEEIIEAIKRITGEENVHLEVPENSMFGDYSTNIAMQVFSKDKDGSPRSLAEKFVVTFKEDKDLSEIVEKIEVAGPGFINFLLKKDVLVDTLLNISSHKFIERYSQKNKGKTVIVEYSSPNIAKPFSIGHLRSTIIGDAVANLLEATGWKVMRDNHLGDWGTQFGKQIYAIKKWGDLEKIKNADNPVKELVELYVKFHEEAEKDPSIEDEARAWFKKLEDGDKEAKELWQMCVDVSWIEFKKIYDKLEVTFSSEFNNGRGLGEAFFEDKMTPIVDELKSNSLLKEGKEGAQLVFFDGDKLPPAMIIKKDGATLYHTRDLATDKYRKENYNPDLIINEVGVEQTLYFQQLFEMERILGWFEKGQRVHISHGLYKMNDRKMSTRRGDVIWLEDVLQTARAKAKNFRNRIETNQDAKDIEVEDTLEPFSSIDDDVSVGALKYNDLKRDPKGDIAFDWDEILNMEGNSGPYLQYTYARCQSVLKKGKFESETAKDLKPENMGHAESELVRVLVHYPEVVVEAAEKYSPNMICNYLYSLAQKFNTFYNSSKIIGGDNEKMRLAVTYATGELLKNGLNLLGIKAPEKM